MFEQSGATFGMRAIRGSMTAGGPAIEGRAESKMAMHLSPAKHEIYMCSGNTNKRAMHLSPAKREVYMCSGNTNKRAVRL